jgi:hypothetical protein
MGPRVLVLACLLFADVMPRGELAIEALGNSFEPIGDEVDRGLKVGVWRNVKLKREERWHLSEPGEWFLRVRSGLYILATHDPKAGGWFTNPLERLEWDGKAWRRGSLAPRKSP